MVVKLNSETVCHAAECYNRATLAYDRDRFAMYCSRECRRADVRANRGKPWEAAWQRSRALLALTGVARPRVAV